MTAVWLQPDDGVELGELLEFLHDWTGYLPAIVSRSLAGYVGGEGYGLDDLRGDLARFAFLLGGEGERLFPSAP